ncbi:hypothetical protein BKA70DRAFT_1337012 [Coprinopsis sp. MPI-PUGE-AT-0042]|nr:hypothetical protein BKA70DRAFT_1337012 [Coprinopsis sp. MPI-PUGE-AT-0042]
MGQGNMTNNVAVTQNDMNVDDAEVDTDEEDEEGDEDFDDDVAAQFALMDQLEPSGRMSEEEQDAHWAALEAAHAAHSHPPHHHHGGGGGGSSSTASGSGSGSSTAHASIRGTGSATSNLPIAGGSASSQLYQHHHHPLTFGSIPARGSTRGGFRGRGGHSATLSSFATLGSWEVSPTAPGPPSSTVGTIIDTSALQQTATTSPTGSRHRYGWTSQPRAAGPATLMPTVTATPAPTSTSVSAMRLNSSRSRTGASMTASPTSRSSVVAPSSTPTSTTTPERNPHRSSTEQDEQSRITASLIEDLGHYLVGWNRHCPSLRIVQIDHEVVWTRRFDGDSWRPSDPRGVKGPKKSKKGKERAA